MYSWWLDTAHFPTPESAGLADLPAAPRLPHGAEQAELLYVGRARKNLHQRILRQHLRRTRSSALRRTLLAVLLTGDGKWTEGASLDSRRRVVLDADAEARLTAWMADHLLLGWARRASKDETDALEAQWIKEHQPALNTDGTEHGRLLTHAKRDFVTAVTNTG
ncbi:GIY-YIG nuclease family protein [Kocuria flava]|uniref:GIY-YIG nuclease family protein n=1 Tax=Kocuria flava TaxID=446860 RepID=UPI003F1BBA76